MSFLNPSKPQSTVWVDGEYIPDVEWALIDKKTHKLTIVFPTRRKNYPNPVIAVYHFPRYMNDRVDFITNEDHLKEVEEYQKYRGYGGLVSIGKEIKQENPYRAMMRQIWVP